MKGARLKVSVLLALSTVCLQNGTLSPPISSERLGSDTDCIGAACAAFSMLRCCVSGVMLDAIASSPPMGAETHPSHDFKVRPSARADPVRATAAASSALGWAEEIAIPVVGYVRLCYRFH
jgi:hypothetical protein